MEIESSETDYPDNRVFSLWSNIRSSKALSSSHVLPIECYSGIKTSWAIRAKKMYVPLLLIWGSYCATAVTTSRSLLPNECCYDCYYIPNITTFELLLNLDWYYINTVTTSQILIRRDFTPVWLLLHNECFSFTNALLR